MSRTTKHALVPEVQAGLAQTRPCSKAQRPPPRYRANIGVGTLQVAESRIIAALLLAGTNEDGWRAAIQDDNILQARSRETAKRIANLLRARLAPMSPAFWRCIADGSMLLATHTCLAAAVKHSPLLGDFLDLVVREQHRLFRPALSYPLWEHYIEDCHSRDPSMSVWRESTTKRLRSTVFGILHEAGYIENANTLKLQKVFIAKEVLGYLEEHGEQYVLRCIQIEP